MMPPGPLMKEHRLIERMIKLLQRELKRIFQDDTVDLIFVEKAVDFIKTYADRCHHGKEEDILFRDLAEKPMREEHRKTMDELISEHVHARGIVKNLIDFKEKYVKGSRDALRDISESIQELIEFYPKHIEKEDKHFFLPAMKYFSDEEQDAMLQEFWEFDRMMIHEKYTKMIEERERIESTL